MRVDVGVWVMGMYCDLNYISNITHRSRRVVVRVDADVGGGGESGMYL